MKTKITNLKEEKRNIEKSVSLAQEISNSLKSDVTLLQPYLEAVLTSVLPTFGSLYPVDARIEYFDLWLLAPESSVLNIIVSCLKVKQSKLICVNYLKKWAKKKLFSRAIEVEQERQNEEVYNELLAIIFSIPDRVASALADEKGGESNIKTMPQILKGDM